MSASIAVERIEVWSFYLVGGGEFQYLKPFAPPLHHRGERTLWKMTGTAAQAQVVKLSMEALGISVELEVNKPIHKNAPHDPSFEPLTPLCPTCAFFDPNVEGQCGLIGWSQESVTFLLQEDFAQEDRASCPEGR